jgi:hypothetical protein
MARPGKTSVRTPELRRTFTIALPTLARDFRVSISTIQRLATDYLLALAARAQAGAMAGAET